MSPRQFILIAAVCAAFISASIADDTFFTDGLSSWTVKGSPEVTVSSNVTTEDGQDVLCVEVSDIPENPTKVSDVRISQSFGDITADQNYQISFQAKADKPGKIVIFVYPDNDPQRVLFRKDINVDLDWKDYSISFIAKDTTSHCVLGFAGLGRTNNRYFFRSIPK